MRSYGTTLYDIFTASSRITRLSLWRELLIHLAIDLSSSLRHNGMDYDGLFVILICAA